jgi:hypothetical protein
MGQKSQGLCVLLAQVLGIPSISACKMVLEVSPASLTIPLSVLKSLQGFEGISKQKY